MRVLVLGGGAIGRSIADSLRGEFEVVIVEKDELRARALEESGFQVVQGDFSYTATLLKAGVDKAELVIITVMDIDTIKKTIYVIRTNNKDVPILTLIPPDEVTLDELVSQINEEFEAGIRVEYAVSPPRSAIRDAVVRTVEMLGERKNATCSLKSSPS